MPASGLDPYDPIDYPIDGRGANSLQKRLANNTSVRVGRIIDVYAGGYVASVNTGEGVQSAVWVGPVRSQFLGIGSLDIPTPDSLAVLLVQPSGPSIILGCLPSVGHGGGNLFDIEQAGVVSFNETQHAEAFDGEQSVLANHNCRRPLDALPGDQGWFNDDGSIIALLRGGLALLKASSLAQVQCYVLDDLVRVISRNYQHWSDWGEETISNDEGEVTKEILASSKDYEVKGLLQKGEEIGILASEGDLKRPYYQLDPEDATGRWRLQAHVGYLGDMMHLWISKPVEERGKLSQENPPAGVTEFYIGQDGQVTGRSVRGFRFEKVNKIRVPFKKKEAFDDEGDSKADSYQPREDVPQFTWNEEHPDAKFLQEEDKHYYDVNEYEVRRYKDHKKDWSVVTEEDASIPDPEEEEAEFEELETISLIDIREDGSICLQGPGGSCIELSTDGNIRIQAAKDLLIETGRDTINVSGRNKIDKVKEQIELSSAEADIRLKAEGSITGFSREKGIILETESGSTANGLLGKNQKFSGIVLRSLKKSAPIILEAQDSNIQLDSKNNLTLRARGNDAWIKAEGKNIGLKSDDLVTVEGKTIQAVSKEKLDLKGAKISQLASTSWTTTAKAFSLTGGQGDILAQAGIRIDKGFRDSRKKQLIPSIRGAAAKVAIVQDPKTPEIKTIVEPYKSKFDGGSLLPKIQFSFLKDKTEYGWESTKLYVARWQQFVENKSNASWPWTQDVVNDTLSWPGKSFTERYGYKNVNTAASAEPNSSAGELKQDLNYIIPR